MTTRLQNVLSAAGVASRRKAAEIIAQGRVSVDGRIVREAGERVDPEKSSVAVDGKPVRAERKRTVAMNKPAGVTTTMSDRFAKRTVADVLREHGVKERLVPAGRLDRDSEGLLVLTNDGDVALRLTHPRFGHVKTYLVEVAGRWSEEKLRVLRGSVEMPDGYVIRPVPVRVVRKRPDNTALLEFKLSEGRKRQIRYMCSAAHLTVLSLKRVAIGAFKMPPGLPPGGVVDLTKGDLDAMFR